MSESTADLLDRSGSPLRHGRDNTSREQSGEAGRHEITTNQSYTIYPERWLILFANFIICIVIGFEKCILPILDVFRKHIGIEMSQYRRLSQIRIMIILFTTLPFSKASQYYGIRLMVSTTIIHYEFFFLPNQNEN